MFLKSVISGLALTLFFAVSAPAQVQVDFSQITCDQLVHNKIGSPRVVAAWFSGFYNGKRDNLIIDMQKFEANLDKVERFCGVQKNFDMTVLKAIDQVTETGK